MLRGLVRLIRYMDGLTEPVEMSALDSLLREANVTREELVVACKFSDVNYARNLLAKSDWYQLLVICWREGQSSPIHDHAGSRCGVRVIDGIATETLFEPTQTGFVRPVSSRDFSKDQVCVTGDSDIHVITNEQSNADLVTLHLYSPPLRMNSYQLEPVPG